MQHRKITAKLPITRKTTVALLAGSVEKTAPEMSIPDDLWVRF
jgi:hypothetical protein